ncbi:MAG: hypothetical protein ACREC6_01840, partial [Hyphomicrobiaceae bacterium]
PRAARLRAAPEDKQALGRSPARAGPRASAARGLALDVGLLIVAGLASLGQTWRVMLRSLRETKLTRPTETCRPPTILSKPYWD